MKAPKHKKSEEPGTRNELTKNENLVGIWKVDHLIAVSIISFHELVVGSVQLLDTTYLPHECSWRRRGTQLVEPHYLAVLLAVSTSSV